jgi:mRNA-degrading endonuclease RelE of RelBE toxin-antitoxin system
VTAVAYGIEYDDATFDHLRTLTAAQRSLFAATVLDQLSHQPTVETRNRKPMKPNTFATWELRIRDLRVYYDVREEPEPVVTIRGVGLKHRNRVYLGGEEYQL